MWPLCQVGSRPEKFENHYFKPLILSNGTKPPLPTPTAQGVLFFLSCKLLGDPFNDGATYIKSTSDGAM